MRCPYCRTRLTELAVECPACRLTLDRATALLGPIPRLGQGVADLALVLQNADSTKIAKALARVLSAPGAMVPMADSNWVIVALTCR